MCDSELSQATPPISHQSDAETTRFALRYKMQKNIISRDAAIHGRLCRRIKAAIGAQTCSMSGRGAIVGSAHAHALLAPPEGRSGSDYSIFILSLTSPTHGCFNSPQGISHTGIQFHQQRQQPVRQVPRRLVMGSQFLLERFWQVLCCLSAAGRMRLRRTMRWHGRKPHVGPVVSQSGNRHVVP